MKTFEERREEDRRKHSVLSEKEGYLARNTIIWRNVVILCMILFITAAIFFDWVVKTGIPSARLFSNVDILTINIMQISAWSAVYIMLGTPLLFVGACIIWFIIRKINQRNYEMYFEDDESDEEKDGYRKDDVNRRKTE